VKESNKRFFNGTMLAFTGRIGYGFSPSMPATSSTAYSKTALARV
jgi:hypothetical protein